MIPLPEEHIEIMEREGHDPRENQKLPPEHKEIRDESNRKRTRRE